MTGESGHFTGSDWHSQMTNRHGFPKNRHSYCTNPLICSRITGMIPLTCPEKAAFGTVWREDNSQNGLQPVVIRKNSCFSSKSGVRHYRRPIPLRKNHGFSWKFGIRPDRRTPTYKKLGFWITSRSEYLWRVIVSLRKPSPNRAPFASPGGQTDTVFQKTGTVIL